MAANVKLTKAGIRAIFKGEGCKSVLDKKAEDICAKANGKCSGSDENFACGGYTGRVSYHATVYARTQHGKNAIDYLVKSL